MERLLLESGSREKERRQPSPRTRTEEGERERVGPTTERPGPAAGSLPTGAHYCLVGVPMRWGRVGPGCGTHFPFPSLPSLQSPYSACEWLLSLVGPNTTLRNMSMFTSLETRYTPQLLKDILAFNIYTNDPHRASFVCVCIHVWASSSLYLLYWLVYTLSVSKQKLRFRKSVGLRSFFTFLAQNCVRCIALTKLFLAS
jgi:hypothetical protein